MLFGLSFLSSFSLSLGDSLIKTEVLSQRAVNPKTTNQPILLPSSLTHSFCVVPPEAKQQQFLTLKVPNKNCSRRHFNFLLLSFEENKA